MFPFPIAKPQKCDIQTFYAMDDTNLRTQAWNKPVGVSHVYMLLIGAGGSGDGTNGGGSGAVTVWYGAAQHVPNTLQIVVPYNSNGYNTAVYYNGRLNYQTLLTANNADFATAGSATTAGPFAASGFYKSTAGQDGVAGSVTASATTFLSGGGATGNNVVANYGYRVTDAAAAGKPGFFMTQPIIVGAGGIGNFAGGIGCGGGNSGLGGSGMVLIASW